MTVETHLIRVMHGKNHVFCSRKVICLTTGLPQVARLNKNIRDTIFWSDFCKWLTPMYPVFYSLTSKSENIIECKYAVQGTIGEIGGREWQEIA